MCNFGLREITLNVNVSTEYKKNLNFRRSNAMNFIPRLLCLFCQQAKLYQGQKAIRSPHAISMLLYQHLIKWFALSF